MKKRRSSKSCRVLDCDITGCSFNAGKECRAAAISLEVPHSICEGVLKISERNGIVDIIGSVGSCREVDCRYQESLRCISAGIHVGLHEDSAHCRVFHSDRGMLN